MIFLKRTKYNENICSTKIKRSGGFLSSETLRYSNSIWSVPHMPKSSTSGFVILFSVILSSLILAIALGVASVALNEVKFSTSARDANNAFFAADTGMEFVLSQDKHPTAYVLDLVNEGGIQTWNLTISDLGSDGNSCAQVSIEKDNTLQPFVETTIISKGYNIGNAFCDSSNPNRTERELKTTYGGGNLSGFWTNVVGADAPSNDLTKTSGASAWDAGAVSFSSVASGDVFMQASTNENNRAKMVGLSSGDTNQSWTDIDFAVYFRGDGTTEIRESGSSSLGNFGAYNAGDVFTVAIISGEVTYYQNGTLLKPPSTQIPSYPISIDTSLFSPSSTIADAVLLSGTYTPFTSGFWTNIVGVSALFNNLTKTGASGIWDAGAVSASSVGSGDVFMQFSSSENNLAKMAGLSNGDVSQHFNDIDFAIYPRHDGSLRIYEQGTNIGIFGTHVAGDVFTVAIISGEVTYYQNGTLLKPPSTQIPSYPISIDTSLFHVGATIINANLLPGTYTFWKNIVGVSASGSENDLAKTSGASAWDAGAVSFSSVGAGDVFMQFTTGESNRNKMVGLSNGDTNQHHSDIDFAVYLRSGGGVQIRENGVNKGDVGTYVAGDVFTVAIISGEVTYYQNGTLLGIPSTGTPSFPVLVDTSFHSPSSNTITDVKLFQATYIP